MTVEAITTLITNTGFPIACVVALAWFVSMTTTRIQDENKERESKLYDIIAAHADKLQEITNTLSKVNESIQEIMSKLEK